MAKYTVREYISYQRYCVVEANNEEEAETIAYQMDDWNETDEITEEIEVSEE